VTINDQLTFKENTASKGSAKRQLVQNSSAGQPQRSEDVTITDADCPFHLWYPATMEIDGHDYESAGHYLAAKSLGRCIYNVKFD